MEGVHTKRGRKQKISRGDLCQEWLRRGGTPKTESCAPLPATPPPPTIHQHWGPACPPSQRERKRYLCCAQSQTLEEQDSRRAPRPSWPAGPLLGCPLLLLLLVLLLGGLMLLRLGLMLAPGRQMAHGNGSLPDPSIHSNVELSLQLPCTQREGQPMGGASPFPCLPSPYQLQPWQGGGGGALVWAPNKEIRNTLEAGLHHAHFMHIRRNPNPAG